MLCKYVSGLYVFDRCAAVARNDFGDKMLFKNVLRMHVFDKGPRIASDNFDAKFIL